MPKTYPTVESQRARARALQLAIRTARLEREGCTREHIEHFTARRIEAIRAGVL